MSMPTAKPEDEIISHIAWLEESLRQEPYDLGPAEIDEFSTEAPSSEDVRLGRLLTERELETLRRCLSWCQNPMEENVAEMPRIYGLDGYGRFIERDGERSMVEAWPFSKRSFLDSLNFYRRIIHRFDIIQWHLGILRHYGLRQWLELRQY